MMGEIMKHECPARTYFIICDLIESLKAIENIEVDSDYQEEDLSQTRDTIIKAIYSVCVDAYLAENEVE